MLKRAFNVNSIRKFDKEGKFSFLLAHMIIDGINNKVVFSL